VSLHQFKAETGDWYGPNGARALWDSRAGSVRRDYRWALPANRFVCSMNCRGVCRDKTLAETFVSTIERESWRAPHLSQGLPEASRVQVRSRAEQR
jgi:hypothetical protein